jgi:hypothetical protein
VPDSSASPLASLSPEASSDNTSASPAASDTPASTASDAPPATLDTGPGPQNLPLVPPAKTTSFPESTQIPTAIPSTTAPSTVRFDGSAIAVIGELVRGRRGLLSVTVANSGTGRATDVVAAVTLPTGVRLIVTRSTARTASVAAEGLVCQTTSDAATCTLGGLSPDQSVTEYLPVEVATDALVSDQAPRVTVSGTNAAGVAPEPVTKTAADIDGTPTTIHGSGLAGRYAGTGALHTYGVGNTLLTCDDTAVSGVVSTRRTVNCAAARRRDAGVKLDNNAYTMVPLDNDTNPSTTLSSSADLNLATGEQVVWAGLYWSAVSPTASPVSATTSVQLRSPGSESYQTVTSDQAPLTGSALPFDGAKKTAYQATADVTEFVRAGGAGRWWVADATARTGASNLFAGWSLQVVTSAPSGTQREVLIADGFQAVRHLRPIDLSISGRPGSSPRLGVVGWEGDDGMSGDQLGIEASRTGGVPAEWNWLDPEGAGQPTNVGRGIAAGGTEPNAFGVDIWSAQGLVPSYTSRPALRASTLKDTWYLGVVTSESAIAATTESP